MNYQFNCISPPENDLLDEIIDDMQEISGTTFFKMVDLEELRNSLMYELGDYYTSRVAVKKDWGNNYFRCTVNNQLYYIFQNSCIEYVFN